MNTDLMTPVTIVADSKINHTHKMLILGSCFAENIGKWMWEGGFNVDLNPYGILYNPLSVAEAINEMVCCKQYAEDDLFEYRGLWHSYMHHGSFSSASSSETLQNINSRLQQSSDTLKQGLDILFITFGTSYIYVDTLTDKVVGNCHKRPEKEFARRRISVEEIVTVYTSLIERLITYQPQLRIVFTVSPIRHLRDGLVENQRSKATLHLAVSQLEELYPTNVSYFPSYEIVQDELRDYRFYADDLTHPSTLAVKYIQERFANVYFSDDTRLLMRQFQAIYKSLSHRPLHPDSDEYKGFLEKLTLKINLLTEKYPYLVNRFKDFTP